jgi:signal transduction histidine kinase
MVQRGEISEINDTELYGHLPIRNLGRARGFRSRLLVPLQSDDGVIGAISVTRVEPGRFDVHHVQLLQTFADQAVIAIQNVRLFNELQRRTRDLSESLEQQTATAEILSSISGSMDDTRPVFEAIVRNLLRLFGTRFAVVQTLNDGIIEMPAADGEAGFERLTQRYPRPLAADTVGGLAMLEKRTIQIQPVLGNPAAPEGTQGFARDFGFDSVLFTPMLSGDKVVGAIGVAQREPKPFDDKQIALISSFASQAAIAIENTRLLRELRRRTDELSQSLDDLRTAQDRLVQTEKLASLGQLTAGIAHEIKNPLNFVNNFSSLSAELTDELDDLLGTASLTDKVREEVRELTGLMRSNLEKVVQHGKRADSIVKNMLLHSREGAGEQRSVDVNALVEESLNLAYHGARAEKAGFNVTLQRDFDAGAGVAELFPQEITRALLNLIANGFYAATRRSGEAGFEPSLLASTRNLGRSVEIRIRDNGAGIPPEVKEKMFNPFFTTKPAGEGTGLGLSMTHDIVVKQHGGRIDVATEPGEFTEFTIVLPRAGGPQNAG